MKARSARDVARRPAFLALAHQAGLRRTDRSRSRRTGRRGAPSPAAELAAASTPLPTPCATASPRIRPRAAGDDRRGAGLQRLCLDAGRRAARAAGRRAALGHVPLSTRGRARRGSARVRVAHAPARPPREGGRAAARRRWSSTPTRGLPVGAVSASWARAARFVRVGAEHIFSGWDHVVFLLGLLLAGAGSARRRPGRDQLHGRSPPAPRPRHVRRGDPAHRAHRAP
jgi:hypothetical protein